MTEQGPITGESQGTDAVGSWDFLHVFLVGAVSYLLLHAVGLCVFLVDKLRLGADASAIKDYALDWRHVIAQGPGQVSCWVLGLLIVRFQDPRRSYHGLGLSVSFLKGLRDGCLYYIPIGLMTWTGILVYGAILNAVGAELPKQEIAAIVQDPLNPGFALFLLAMEVAVFAPLAEEMFFRGLLQGYLRRYLSPWLCFFVVGAAFGSVHGYAHAVPLALFGVGLCWLREEKGLYACVVAHGLHNAIVFFLLQLGAI